MDGCGATAPGVCIIYGSIDNICTMDWKLISALVTSWLRTPSRSTSTNVGFILDHKDVLQCVYYSEECKIDTVKAKMLKKEVSRHSLVLNN